jgi:flagellar biosynthetic protein FlhB
MADSSGEKTEEPTPQRLAESRRRGEIAKSRDLASGVGLLAVAVALVVGGGSWVGGLLAYTRLAIRDCTRDEPFERAGEAALRAVGGAVALPLGVAVLAALAAGLMQSGGLIAPEAVKLDIKRVMPSLRKVFGLQAFAEIGKGLIKVAVILAIAYYSLRPAICPLVRLSGQPVRSVLVVLGELCGRLGLRLAAAAAVIGVGDYLWQRHAHRKKLRMSRDEVKREHKESEGDPSHKAERHRLHQELIQQRMVAEVRKADLVVVNPDHIAVAIKYDADGPSAPVVVAKGERLVAEQIKQAAREAGVPIFRDVTLARSLREVEEGDEIPEALYEAVAELLAVARRVPETAKTPSAQPISPEASKGSEVSVPRGSWTRV